MTMPGRSLIIAPRLPAKPKKYTGDPFTSDGDIVMDCGEPGCGWHAMGPRLEAKKAWREHHKMYHPQATGVVLLNTPRQ